MITKKQRQSSRSYKQRQAIAQTHFNRAPQMHAKGIHADKTILSSIANIFMKLFHRKQNK